MLPCPVLLRNLAPHLLGIEDIPAPIGSCPGNLPAPETQSGPISDPSLLPDADPDPVPADDTLVQVAAAAAAQIEVNQIPDWEEILLPTTGSAYPRYFVYGAPSMEDLTPHACPINEARERVARGWRTAGYSIRFTPMNTFALQKEESVRLPDGSVYSISSLYVERPYPL